jgi:hypothetical protein
MRAEERTSSAPDPREQDHGGRHGGADERIEVGEEMLEAPLDRQRAPVGAAQGDGRGKVAGHPEKRDREHQAPVHMGR